MTGFKFLTHLTRKDEGVREGDERAIWRGCYRGVGERVVGVCGRGKGCWVYVGVCWEGGRDVPGRGEGRSEFTVRRTVQVVDNDEMRRDVVGGMTGLQHQ